MMKKMDIRYEDEIEAVEDMGSKTSDLIKEVYKRSIKSF